MRWQGRRTSGRVEDRRGMGGGRLALGGGCGSLILILIVAWLTGADPLALLQQVGGGGGVEQVPGGAPSGPTETGNPEEDRLAQFVAVVLADTEETWTRIFAERGHQYELPSLVLFRGSTPSACGMGSAAVGPFYCPRDGKLYLDLTFFDQLDRRFGAPGDFAQAYVIAHEVGHHVQNLLGIAERVTRSQAGADSRAAANEMSVRLELQADCLAGVWGSHAAGRGLLEPGDAEEGLAAAAAIGDDRLQSRTQGQVAPESWTHGSSQMRVEWLRRGLEAGDPDACETFGG